MCTGARVWEQITRPGCGYTCAREYVENQLRSKRFAHPLSPACCEGGPDAVGFMRMGACVGACGEGGVCGRAFAGRSPPHAVHLRATIVFVDSSRMETREGCEQFVGESFACCVPG